MVSARKQTHMPWKTAEISEIKPCIYGQLIFDKSAKSTTLEKGWSFNKQYWESWVAACKRIKMNSYSHCLLKSIQTALKTST
jgi:hypothetical protein